MDEKKSSIHCAESLDIGSGVHRRFTGEWGITTKITTGKKGTTKTITTIPSLMMSSLVILTKTEAALSDYKK